MKNEWTLKSIGVYLGTYVAPKGTRFSIEMAASSPDKGEEGVLLLSSPKGDVARSVLLRGDGAVKLAQCPSTGLKSPVEGFPWIHVRGADPLGVDVILVEDLHRVSPDAPAYSVRVGKGKDGAVSALFRPITGRGAEALREIAAGVVSPAALKYAAGKWSFGKLQFFGQLEGRCLPSNARERALTLSPVED